MDHKASLRLLTLLLVFSFVFSRNLKSISLKEEDGVSVLQDLVKQGFTRRLLEEEEESSFIEGRMDHERLDYTPAGANKNHDPKPPGSA